MENAGGKIHWSGLILGVQPRIRLTRSFDERYHDYRGYMLLIEGVVDGVRRTFTVGIGPVAHEKHRFQLGGEAEGEAVPVENASHDTVEFHRASKLKYRSPDDTRHKAPPWHGIPPPLDTYQERGHRRLAVQTYDNSCTTCQWGALMPVALIPDHWKPDIRKYRTETFCYGPKSCALYKPGPTRKVPGRKGMSWEEADWVDKESTAHRGEDE